MISIVICFPVGTFLWQTIRIAEASHKTTIENQETHLFTPQEASKLLPDVKPKVKELIECKKVIAKMHKELERYGLLGFRTPEVAEKAAQLDGLVDEVTRKIAELEDFGVQVKDLDLGLVDFPAERYGETVLLCWRYGEAEVTFWHKMNEGFNGRKSLKLQVVHP